MGRGYFIVFLIMQLSALLPDFSVVDPNAVLPTLFSNTLSLLMWENKFTAHTKQQCAAVLTL